MSTLEQATPIVAAGAPEHRVTIRPPTAWGELSLREVWAYRELLYFLCKRDLLIRYKQSLFGISWAVLQPLALTLIFYVFFGRLAKVPHEDVPYPLFAMTALVPWQFAANSVGQAAASLVGDQNLLTKVYFPRLVIPVGRVLALTVDLVLGLVVLAAFMAAYGVAPPLQVLMLPLVFALEFATVVAVGTGLAALNVRYRDVAVAVPFMVQVWLFATPIVYPGSLVTGAWQYVYAVNPLVSVISATRWAVLGTDAPAFGAVAVSAASALLMLLAALTYFRRTERFFADVV